MMYWTSSPLFLELDQDHLTLFDDALGKRDVALTDEEFPKFLSDIKTQVIAKVIRYQLMADGVYKVRGGQAINLSDKDFTLSAPGDEEVTVYLGQYAWDAYSLLYVSIPGATP
jgi:hypothetical protein